MSTFNLLGYSSNNIGDDFQSYILEDALRLRGQKGRINRDRQSFYTEPAKLLVTGFMTKAALPFRDNIKPLFLACWMGPLVLEKEGVVDYLLKNVDLTGFPIGCRDRATEVRLIELGVPCQFVGCPSILCRKPFRAEYKDVAVFVDVKPRSIGFEGSYEWSTNKTANSQLPAARITHCKDLHNRLAGASVVITNRIHAALPSLGMGIPTIFVDDGVDIKGRLTALPPSVRIWKPEELKKIKIIPKDHLYDVSAYKARVRRKIRAAEKALLDM